MMQAAGVPETTVPAEHDVTFVAMLYSTFAIYASGSEAVLGGTLALGIGFIIWGFIAPRFASEARAAFRNRVA